MEVVLLIATLLASPGRELEFASVDAEVRESRWASTGRGTVPYVPEVMETACTGIKNTAPTSKCQRTYCKSRYWKDRALKADAALKEAEDALFDLGGISALYWRDRALKAEGDCTPPPTPAGGEWVPCDMHENIQGATYSAAAPGEPTKGWCTVGTLPTKCHENRHGSMPYDDGPVMTSCDDLGWGKLVNFPEGSTWCTKGAFPVECIQMYGDWRRDKAGSTDPPPS